MDSLDQIDMDWPDKYDFPKELDGADPDDVRDAIGAAGEQSLTAVGDLFGGETGAKIAQTAIDGIHAAMKALAGLFSR